jgi:hypothetical protein
LPGLPTSINEAVCDVANQTAREAIPRIRRALGEIRFGAVVGLNPDPLRLAISGREFVHTSYFDCEKVIDLVCTHIRLSSRSPDQFPDGSQKTWEEWVREYKTELATLLAERGD